MGKLWDKGHDIDGLIARFTVGNDYLIDRRLVKADCLASLAHAAGLERIGLLAADELEGLRRELAAIVRDHDAGQFSVTAEDEDCHTAIENRLADRLGETGKKIHTGRSRNDQVQAALRVYARSALHAILLSGAALARELLDFAERQAEAPMPGRTHMQIAMPSSVGLWAGAFGEDLLDSLSLLRNASLLLDQSPLGAAAGYGVPLPLDRQLVSDLLGFRRVQNNVMYVNNSRGKFESVVIDALDQIMLSLGKLAGDIILFSTPEFGYFSLPRELCSGSSIMPQKKNPDGLELVRAKSGLVSGLAVEVKNIIRGLPSGYNRDLQDTKEPFLRAMDVSGDCLAVMRLSIDRLEVHSARLLAGFCPEIFATDAAYELVASGLSFREAYRRVGAALEDLTSRDALDALHARTSSGTPGNLNLAPALETAEYLVRDVQSDMVRVAACYEGLIGFPVATA